MAQMVSLNPGQFFLECASTGEELSAMQIRGPVAASPGVGNALGQVQPANDSCVIWVADWDDELRVIVCLEAGEVPNFESLRESALKTGFMPLTNLVNVEPANELPI